MQRFSFCLLRMGAPTVAYTISQVAAQSVRKSTVVGGHLTHLTANLLKHLISAYFFTTGQALLRREVAGLHVHDVKLIHMQHRLSFKSTFAPTLEHEYARQGDLLLVLLRRAQFWAKHRQTHREVPDKPKNCVAY